MQEFKKIRTFLSSLDDSQFQYLNIQMSFANDAKRMISDFNLTLEQFGSMMGLNQRQVEKYLNGSFDYTLIHMAKMRANWRKLEIDFIESDTERHEILKVATNIVDNVNYPLINNKHLLQIGQGIQCIGNLYANGFFSSEKIYYIKNTNISKDYGINADDYITVLDDDGIERKILLTTKDFVIKNNYKNETNNKPILNDVQIGESIFCPKEVIELKGYITVGEPYEVVDFDDSQQIRHLCIIDNKKEKLFVPITSPNFKPTVEKTEIVDEEFGKIARRILPNYLSENKANLSTGTGIQCMNTFTGTGTFTFEKWYYIANKHFSKDDKVDDSNYVTVFDDENVEIKIPLTSKQFVVFVGKKEIPEDTGNFKGKYIIHATHLQEGDVLICVNETHETNPDAKFTYSQSYAVWKESQYHSNSEDVKKDYVTVLDDNNKEVQILLTSKQFVYSK